MIAACQADSSKQLQNRHRLPDQAYNPSRKQYMHFQPLTHRLTQTVDRKVQNFAKGSIRKKAYEILKQSWGVTFVTCIFEEGLEEGKINLAPVRLPQQQFMKFTPIFAGLGQQSSDKPLYSSASSKVLLREEDFEPAEVVRERVIVATGELSQQLKHYQWRNRTEFPIVRVTACQVKLTSGQRVELEVLRESVPLMLDQLADLPLFRVLYLLKEALIGYERLVARFGTFKITQRMIGINQAHKCRVWLNENLASNAFQPLGSDEQGFIKQVAGVFEEKTLKGKTMGLFYTELEKCNSFAAALSFIEHYTKENKMAIPSLFKSDRLPQAKTHLNNKFHPSLTMARSPRFINSLRDTLTPTTKHANQAEKSHQEEKLKEENKQEYKPTLLALKKSAETRADIYGSGTMTITDSKSRQDLLEHNQFLSAQEIVDHPPEKMQKSEFLQFKSRGERAHKPTHRVTNRQLFSCFTPQPQVRQHQHHEHWDMGSFLSPPQEDKEGLEDSKDGLEEELESLFERNNWEQRIEGLFGSEKELKRSVHAGEPQWRQSQQELSLLQNFGKSVQESAIHGER